MFANMPLLTAQEALALLVCGLQVGVAQGLAIAFGEGHCLSALTFAGWLALGLA